MTGGERPYYVPIGNEEQVFKAAFRQDLSVLLKGPTGCGKTRFVEAMAFDLDRPLITVACHDDLTTADLVGRFLLERDATIFGWTVPPRRLYAKAPSATSMRSWRRARTRRSCSTRWLITVDSYPSTAWESPCRRQRDSAWSSPTTPVIRACSRT